MSSPEQVNSPERISSPELTRELEAFLHCPTPAAWLDWALDRTSRVAFTQDYLDGHDATIVLRHD